MKTLYALIGVCLSVAAVQAFKCYEGSATINCGDKDACILHPFKQDEKKTPKYTTECFSISKCEKAGITVKEASPFACKQADMAYNSMVKDNSTILEFLKDTKTPGEDQKYQMCCCATDGCLFATKLLMKMGSKDDWVESMCDAGAAIRASLAIALSALVFAFSQR